MLSYMTSTGVGSSPLAVAALALVQGGATVADLERRFAESGADLRPGVAEGLLTELESLGLVRIASRGARLESTSSRVSDGAWSITGPGATPPCR